ncbi:hypothetical protein CGRA01v4_00381 [Colletotrichum graminicola]|nr:hypothetical protein CGRA01v4_00381 [Colletotrichum graminicola]
MGCAAVRPLHLRRRWVPECQIILGRSRSPSLTPHSFRTASRSLAGLRGPQASSRQARLARLFGMAQDVGSRGSNASSLCRISLEPGSRARRIPKGPAPANRVPWYCCCPNTVCPETSSGPPTCPLTREARDLASVFVALAARSTAHMAAALACGRDGGLQVRLLSVFLFFFFSFFFSLRKAV